MECNHSVVELYFASHNVHLTNYHIKMEQGTIKRLMDRGFGFIAREGEEKDLFFHSNELQGVEFKDLKEGDKVQFEVSESPKGPNATKVSRA
jgi:CspA family cold shock protein